MVKKSILRIFGFLLIIIAINFLLDFFYKTVIVNSAIDGRKDIQFKKFDGKLKYLILGDSYMQSAINPEIFDSSFNYASSNENFAQTYYKLKNIVGKKLRKPEYVILPVDISSFSSFRTDRFKYDPFWIRYVDYFELAQVKKNTDYIYKWFSASFCSYAGNYDMIFKFVSTLRIGKRENIILGYLPRFDSFARVSDRNKEAKDRAELYLKGYNALDEDMIFYYKKILDYCENQNIKVIIMRLPISDEYFAYSATLNPPDEYYKKINEISSNYHNIVAQYDFRKLYENHPEYFRNPDHMNNKSAPVFSKMLNDKFNGLY